MIYLEIQKTGMILQKQRELNLDLGRLILICDKAGDMQAVISAAVGCSLFKTNDEPAELHNLNSKRITTLSDALLFLNRTLSQREAQ